MERKAQLLPHFWNKNAPQAPYGGVSRVGYQLVRMRSPVQIWIAAPTLSTENGSFRCFLFCTYNFLRENGFLSKWGASEKPIQKPIRGSKKDRPGFNPDRLFLVRLEKSRLPFFGSPCSRGCTYQAWLKYRHGPVCGTRWPRLHRW